jgi:Pyruvate/2-oxoacid:ferredoxin oxidoreductase delta subunit
MKRTIIKIDDEKCNGCGICIPDCPEGALQMIDGKARLVSDLFCDGLGACIGTCPQGAISTEVREADAYDERRVMEENIIPKGENTIKAHLKHLKDHNETAYYQEALDALKGAGINIGIEEKPAASPCGCPGTLAKVIEREDDAGCCGAETSVPSQLRQWPVELHLLNPDAAYFKDADLLVAADCTAFSYGDFHRDFIQGKAVAMFCPKLDNSAETYIERMTEILSRNNIKSITVARMEVPCCGGTTAIIQEALKRSGKNIPLTVKVISISGEILS